MWSYLWAMRAEKGDVAQQKCPLYEVCLKLSQKDAWTGWSLGVRESQTIQETVAAWKKHKFQEL